MDIFKGVAKYLRAVSEPIRRLLNKDEKSTKEPDPTPELEQSPETEPRQFYKPLFEIPSESNNISWIKKYIGIWRDSFKKVSSKAQSLTYATAMSIVPICVAVYAVARGFSKETELWSKIEELIGGDKELTQKILESVSNSVELTSNKNGLFLLTAIIVLLYAVHTTFYKICETFNSLRNERTSGWWKMLPKTFIFIFLLPFLIIVLGFIFDNVASVNYYVPSALHGLVDWMFRWFVAWTVFFCGYKWLPTKVSDKWKMPLLSSLISATVFTIWHYIYVQFQDIIFNYNVVYGTFATIPFFLIWTWIAWVIFLLGDKFAYELEKQNNQCTLKDLSVFDRNYALLATLCAVVQNPNEKENDIRDMLKCTLPSIIVTESLSTLCKMKMIIKADGDEGYQVNQRYSNMDVEFYIRQFNLFAEGVTERPNEPIDWVESTDVLHVINDAYINGYSKSYRGKKLSDLNIK